MTEAVQHQHQPQNHKTSIVIVGKSFFEQRYHQLSTHEKKKKKKRRHLSLIATYYLLANTQNALQ